MSEWIVRIVLGVLLALWSAWGLPYLKAKLGNEKANRIALCIDTAVQAAEQMLKDATGEEKLDFVCENLAAQGIDLTQSVRLAVEAAVAKLPHKQDK